MFWMKKTVFDPSSAKWFLKRENHYVYFVIFAETPQPETWNFKPVLQTMLESGWVHANMDFKQQPAYVCCCWAGPVLHLQLHSYRNTPKSTCTFRSGQVFGKGFWKIFVYTGICGGQAKAHEISQLNLSLTYPTNHLPFHPKEPFLFYILSIGQIDSYYVTRELLYHQHEHSHRHNRKYEN